MRKLVVEWKKTAIYSIAIVLVAFVLRIINLTILPVFADEAIYIRWAQVMRAETTLRFLPLSDGKQPLFMWTVIPFLKLFEDPLFAGRIVSVLTGLGSLVGIFVLSYLLFKSRKAALVSSLIYAISPFTVFFDRMALVDSMLTMFGVWTVIFSYLSVKKLRLDMAMLAGFALGGAALTKSPALFFALLLPTVLLFLDLPKNKSERMLHLTKVAGLLLTTLVIAFGMYNILRLGPNFHMLTSRNFDYVYPLSHILENPFDPFLSHFDGALGWIRTLGPELLVLLVFIGIIMNFSKNKRAIIFLIIWALTPIVIQSIYAKVLTARYIYFTLPYFILLAGTSFLQKLQTKGRTILYTVLGVYIAHSVFLDLAILMNPESARLPRSERSGYLEEWSSGTGIKETADHIKTEHLKEPEVPIVVGTEGYFGTLPDGLQIYLDKIPNVTVIGTGLDISQVPVQLKESVNSGNKTYLVANSSRLKFDKDFSEYGLEEIAKYKKADRPDGTFDYFYLFRVNETDNIRHQ